MDSYKGKWHEFFGNDNPIYLEIGSGSGNFAQGMERDILREIIWDLN